MNQAESIAIHEANKEAFPEAIVSMLITTGDNTTVTATGLRTGVAIARTVSGAGIADNQDFSVWTLKSAFDGVPVSTLRGRMATVTYAGIDARMRILATREHALGGLVMLQFGEGDRVAV
jgi:hypothetical protein